MRKVNCDMLFTFAMGRILRLWLKQLPSYDRMAGTLTYLTHSLSSNWLPVKHTRNFDLRTTLFYIHSEQ